MGSFDRMRRRNDSLYRGSHGRIAREVMRLAVGPIRSVAVHIRENGLDVPESVRSDAAAFFSRALLNHLQPLRHDTLADHPAMVTSVAGWGSNRFTLFEHVLYEPGAQINSPRTSRLLESVSSNPQVGILYAYGLQPDPWFNSRNIQPWGDTPNSDAFVAILPPSTTLDHAMILDTLTNIAAADGLTVDEARRRMDRDSEELLEGAVQPSQIIDLPNFDITNPLDSLNAAADELIGAGAAT